MPNLKKALKKSNRGYGVLLAVGNQMANHTGGVRGVLSHLIPLRHMPIVQLRDVATLGLIHNVSPAVYNHCMRHGMRKLRINF